ncbi:MFS transporter [Chloroflexota bacterium]
MTKRRRFPRIFFGWWTVLAGGFLALVGHGYYVYGFSALFKPIASELGFSRAVTSVAAGIGRFEGGIEAPASGWLADKIGPRLVILFGISVIGISLILMYYINSLWAFYVVWGVMLGTGLNVALAIPLEKAITNWFVKKRGLAMGVRWSLFASLWLLPVITWLIVTYGWRMTCVTGGVVMLVVGLPLTWFFIRDQRPEYYGLLPDGATSEAETKEDTGATIGRGAKYAADFQEIEFTLRQAMRTPAYWLLIVVQVLQLAGRNSLIMHQIPLLTDMGLDPTKAANVTLLAGVGGLATRFAVGFMADRVKKQHLRFLYAGAIMLQTIGITIFLLNQTLSMVYPLLILHNVGGGVNVVITTIIVSRYFGRKAFGSIRGTSTAVGMPLGILAPIYMGWIYDTTGSYITGFTVFAIAGALGAVLIFLALPPKPPTEVTDIRKFL